MLISGLGYRFLIAYFLIGYFSSSLYSQDKRRADSLINILRSGRIVDDSSKYRMFEAIATHHPKPDSSGYYAEQALNIAAKDNNHMWMGKSYANIGYSYKLKGDLYQALNAFLKSKQHYERAGNEIGVATLLGAISGIHRVQGSYDRAISSYHKSIDLLKKHQDTLRLSSVLMNLGDLYLQIKYHDSALFYFKKSLIFQNSLRYRLGIAYSFGNIGLVFAEQDQYDSAEYYISQSTKILEELGDRYPIAVYQTYMADIYKDKGDLDKALKYAHNSLQISEEEGLKEQIRDASLKLSELYREKNDFQKAYTYQNQYIAYRDSINNEDVIRKMADLRTEYEVSKKQIEVDLLEQRSKTQTVVNFALAAIVLLLSILATIVYQNSQKRKKTNLLLSDQKEEIVTQRDKMEELVNMKDRFFGIISHDLRSPVNSLQGITRLLGYYVNRREIDQIAEFVSLADNAINNLSSLLDNLLGWALSQQGSLPYRPEKFKFYYVVEEVKRLFSNTASSKNIRLETDVDKELEIFGDRDSIFALTRNLVNNAIKFTRDGGQVSISVARDERFVTMVVMDTGIGIPEDQINKIFELDKNKSTKGTAGERGSGLGLALCKDLVELNGGAIHVESMEGKGTRFTVSLPAVEEVVMG